MKTAIIFYGHRGTGKSTLVAALVSVLNGYSLFSIDEYRKRFNPHSTLEGEQEACSRHDLDYDSASLKIADTGGSSWLIKKYLFERESTLFIQLVCSEDIRKARIRYRESTVNWRPTPWPYLQLDLDNKKIEEFMQKNFDFLTPDLVLDSTKSIECLTNEVRDFLKAENAG